MEQGISPKVALVTGSGRRRVGNVVAVALARAGYAVAIHYHKSADSARETVAQLRQEGFAAESFAADVAVETEVEQLFTAVLKRFGRLDALVTTSSVWSEVPLERTTSADLLHSFQINTLGTFLCAKVAGLIMAAQDSGGAIVTIGDWAIKRPYVNYSAYFTAKGAIPTLTRTLAVELGQRNPKVRVNCIHPGPVMFPENASDTEQQELVDSTLVKSANCPETIAQAVLFLVDNSFVTGTCLHVDGGRSIFAGETRARPI